ncbi:Tn7-like element transposition protein TnsE [Amphritea sp. 2_MG-2023]|uniref:Tn7-like element transposition protein TnsE n=1 Tax=Amphritea TaxID=515417 RepID=UPI002091DF82|nr:MULTISPECIES: Tn7-like element transposition protein TnsE [Amphritea]MDO6416983.1 Tn7-like element transposition protein TnsE [Amphritea sp. 2_MG-2023]
MLDSAKNVFDDLPQKFSKWISINFPAIRQFPIGLELYKVHGVFRSNALLQSKNLFIAVEWMNRRYTSIPIELATLIAPGRVFADKKVIKQSELERLEVKIIRKVGVDRFSENYHFKYDTDKGVISVLGFELARVLFFHNRHLVNAAYSANGLAELAFIDRSSQPIKIRFPDSTSYPVSHLQTKKSRAHLAWLMLDERARSSFFTIYQRFNGNGNRIAFDFSPPDLTDWILEVSIERDISTGDMNVRRIENITVGGISESIFRSEIYHPKQKTRVRLSSAGTGKRGKAPDVDIDPELDMGDIPAFSARRHNQKEEGFSFNIPDSPDVVLVDVNESSVPSPIAIEGIDTEPEKAGVGMPSRDGTAQEFDPVLNQVDDVIDEAKELPHKFLIFEEVVNKLGLAKGIKLVSLKCGNFPVPTNKSEVIYQTKDNKPLRYFMAILEVNQRKVIMLEADMTSLTKTKGASTLILGLKDDTGRNFHEIVQHFSDNSASWGHTYIRQRTNFLKRCNHPRWKEKGKTLTEAEYLHKWVDVLKRKLSEVPRVEEST